MNRRSGGNPRIADSIVVFDPTVGVTGRPPRRCFVRDSSQGTRQVGQKALPGFSKKIAALLLVEAPQANRRGYRIAKLARLTVVDEPGANADLVVGPAVSL